MDIVGRFYLADGTEVKVVTGVDDHSRFCVCARIVARATARPVCDALTFALRQHGAPNEILTDNGKVFTARFGPGPGPVLFDRICHHFGITHRLTAPYSPTTTGKVERFHRTYRAEFLVDHDRQHATIEEAQEALDAWVVKYNTERPHQSLGDRPPAERFALAAAPTPLDTDLELVEVEEPTSHPDRRESAGGSTNEDRSGSTASAIGSVRPSPANQSKSSSKEDWSRFSTKVFSSPLMPSAGMTEPRPSAPEHQELVDRDRRVRACPSSDRSTAADPFRSPGLPIGSGAAGDAERRGGHRGRIGPDLRQREVIRVHQIRHDRSKEHGAFATPNGRPRNRKVA